MKVAICDRNLRYLEDLMEYLDGRENCPFELLGFTDVEGLLTAARADESLRIAVVSEEMYVAELEELAVKILILDEGLDKCAEQVYWVDKYQPAREIYKVIMGLCIEEEDLPALPSGGKETRILGFYSPIKRSMQTAFALALGRSLSSRYKVLYVSFEQYAGLRNSMQGQGGKDLFDLLYYLKEAGDKFAYRFSQVEQFRGDMAYIPPVIAGQNLVYVTVREWLTLINRLKTLGKFDFVLLDLSDSMQGIFEILRMCEKIFTATVSEGTAIGKMEQYEYLLRMYEYDDVLVKTLQKKMPEFEMLPDDGELWTLGLWRDFIHKVEVEDLGVQV